MLYSYAQIIVGADTIFLPEPNAKSIFEALNSGVESVKIIKNRDSINTIIKQKNLENINHQIIEIDTVFRNVLSSNYFASDEMQSEFMNKSEDLAITLEIYHLYRIDQFIRISDITTELFESFENYYIGLNLTGLLDRINSNTKLSYSALIQLDLLLLHQTRYPVFFEKNKNKLLVLCNYGLISKFRYARAYDEYYTHKSNYQIFGTFNTDPQSDGSFFKLFNSDEVNNYRKKIGLPTIMKGKNR